jgi:hypothetical protein
VDLFDTLMQLSKLRTYSVGSKETGVFKKNMKAKLADY